MSIKTRLIKLEMERGGQGKIYTFRMSDGMDMKAIQEEFCKERGIEPKANDLFIFLPRFGDTEPTWKYLYECDIKS